MRVLYYALIMYHMTMNGNLWKNYRDVLWETFPDFQRQPIWADWTGKKGTRLTAQDTHMSTLSKRGKLTSGTILLLSTITFFTLKLGVTFPVLVWILWDLTRIG